MGALRKPAQRELLPPEWPEPDDPLPPSKDPGPEDVFAMQLSPLKLRVERQVLFAKAALGRLWRLDFGFRDYMVAVEIEGIVPKRIGRELVVGGRHGSIAGIIEDMDKYNSAALLGWTVLRFPQKYVKQRHALDMTLRVLTARGWQR